jgi:hypothetical protein
MMPAEHRVGFMGGPLVTQNLALITTAFTALALCGSPVRAAAPEDARAVDILLRESPAVTISNGLIDATVALPDATRGFYRGTRFDWSGMITRLCYGGQRFYGPWFDRVSPSVRDFAYDGDTLIASTASGATGPAEEFDPTDDPPGFDAAKPGASFIKLGVGVLQRPDAGEYDHYRVYEILDHGRWRARQSGPRSVEFVQEIADPHSGYAYRYLKRIDLPAGKARMVISHTLENRGTRPIRSSLYDHNFLTLDDHPTQQGLLLAAPFAIAPGIASSDAAVAGRQLTLARTPAAHTSIAFAIDGFGPDATDYRLDITSADGRAMVSVSGDTPLAKVQFWSIPRVVAAEPYIRIDVPAGHSQSWRYVYSYQTAAAGQSAAPGCSH